MIGVDAEFCWERSGFRQGRWWNLDVLLALQDARKMSAYSAQEWLDLSLMFLLASEQGWERNGESKRNRVHRGKHTYWSLLSHGLFWRKEEKLYLALTRAAAPHLFWGVYSIAKLFLCWLLPLNTSQFILFLLVWFGTTHYQGRLCELLVIQVSRWRGAGIETSFF